MNGGYGQYARVLTQTMKEKTMALHSTTRPRSASEQVADIHDELYQAVYAGDLAKAQALLDELALIAAEPLDRRLRLAKQGRLVA
jgi:DNA-binding FadR family transcriptional regulator